MSISILEQEGARNLAGLLCIVGLLVFYGIELILGRPMTQGMLWVLLGLIAALFGLDDINTVFGGGKQQPPVEIYSEPSPNQPTHPTNAQPNTGYNYDYPPDHNDDYGDEP